MLKGEQASRKKASNGVASGGSQTRANKKDKKHGLKNILKSMISVTKSGEEKDDREQSKAEQTTEKGKFGVFLIRFGQ